MKKEQEIQNDIDVLKKDNEEMGREIISLKRQIGGYKAANERYRKDLEKYKKEAEQKANRILELIANQENIIKELEDATNKIKGLEYLCEVNKNKYEKAQEKFTEVDKEWTVLNANVEWYNSLPWYRRIFKKI